MRDLALVIRFHLEIVVLCTLSYWGFAVSG
jgi:hypothetical protein